MLSSRLRRSPREAFTLIELLVVVVIIGVLIALLVPAIAGGVRKAREASQSTEMRNLDLALTAYKVKYGVFPPSRVLLVESGDYSPVNLKAQYGTDTAGLARALALVDRSMVHLRALVIRAPFSKFAAPPPRRSRAASTTSTATASSTPSPSSYPGPPAWCSSSAVPPCRSSSPARPASP